MVPIDKGGANTSDNGQTLCSEHNLLKRTTRKLKRGKDTS
ncbi:MAG: hypothetical protein DRI26_06050 [Chloroflexi bacterium]|nr:MAG: hypothetical protein DRI26_06050 [Chloroflexota bacterium]